MSTLLWVREAIASAASSHDVDCECTTCRAAAGDEDALAEILTEMAALESAEAEAVRNRTPEPDGAVRIYFERVPPFVKTPLEALAWQADVPPEVYAEMVVET